MGCQQSVSIKSIKSSLQSNVVKPSENTSLTNQDVLIKFDLLLKLLSNNAQKTPYGLYINSLNHPYSTSSSVK